MIKITIDKEMGRSVTPAVKGFPSDRVFMHESAGRTTVYYEKTRFEPPLNYESPQTIANIISTGGTQGEYVTFVPTQIENTSAASISKVALPKDRVFMEDDGDTVYATKLLFEFIRSEKGGIYRSNDSVATITATGQIAVGSTDSNITTGTVVPATADRVIEFGGHHLTLQSIVDFNIKAFFYHYYDYSGVEIARMDNRGNYVEGTTNIANFPWNIASVQNCKIYRGSTYTGVPTDVFTANNVVVHSGGQWNTSGSTALATFYAIEIGTSGYLDSRFNSGVINYINIQSTLTAFSNSGSIAEITLGLACDTNISNNTATFQRIDVSGRSGFECLSNATTKSNITIRDRQGVKMLSSHAENGLTITRQTSNKIVFVDASPANIVTNGGLEALDLYTLIGPRLTYVGEVYMFNATNGDVIEGIRTASGAIQYGPPLGAIIKFSNGSGLLFDLDLNDVGSFSSGAEVQPFILFNRTNKPLAGGDGVLRFADEIDFEVYTQGTLMQRLNSTY
jgi:hypothetical protein